MLHGGQGMEPVKTITHSIPKDGPINLAMSIDDIIEGLANARPFLLPTKSRLFR